MRKYGYKRSGFKRRRTYRRRSYKRYGKRRSYKRYGGRRYSRRSGKQSPFWLINKYGLPHSQYGYSTESNHTNPNFAFKGFNPPYSNARMDNFQTPLLGNQMADFDAFPSVEGISPLSSNGQLVRSNHRFGNQGLLGGTSSNKGEVLSDPMEDLKRQYQKLRYQHDIRKLTPWYERSFRDNAMTGLGKLGSGMLDTYTKKIMPYAGKKLVDIFGSAFSKSKGATNWLSGLFGGDEEPSPNTPKKRSKYKPRGQPQYLQYQQQQLQADELSRVRREQELHDLFRRENLDDMIDSVTRPNPRNPTDQYIPFDNLYQQAMRMHSSEDEEQPDFSDLDYDEEINRLEDLERRVKAYQSERLTPEYQQMEDFLNTPVRRTRGPPRSNFPDFSDDYLSNFHNELRKEGYSPYKGF